MKSFIKYFHLWKKLTVNSFLISLTSRLNASIFLIGKIMRFGFFIVFLLAIFTNTQFLANYSALQMIFVYLSFNLIDNIPQLFFREVYRFRPLIVTGQFDLILVKPMNPLFRALAGGADPLDLIMLIPFVGTLIFVGNKIGYVTWFSLGAYIILLLNGLLIATAFHILVLALAILTTEIDHTVMIYRDLTSMGRVPIDIYQEPLRSILTFVIPVGIMMTFPAKAFLGLISPQFILIACIFGIFFFLICLRFWRYALTQYASASS